ncbi:dynein axonemal intermediate chain 7 [Candoia aspera]|uniref:dynein axonemal intermediate chain 7 n=1 Tax=Candoia aspera TaxID=51853 RepID=UPI002FD7F3E8
MARSTRKTNRFLLFFLPKRHASGLSKSSFCAPGAWGSVRRSHLRKFIGEPEVTSQTSLPTSWVNSFPFARSVKGRGLSERHVRRRDSLPQKRRGGVVNNSTARSLGRRGKMSAGGKKMSKAERLRLLREEEEQRQIEEEQARLRAELEEAVRAEKERIEREKTELLEARDQERRGVELSELHELEDNFFLASQWKLKSRALAKWEHYTGCDGSPDPTIPQEINTYMSLWLEDTNNDITTVIEKGSQVLELIAKLETNILETSFGELSSFHVAQYQETIFQLQNLLHHKYNQATEQLLKQASSYAESESGNMEVVIKEKDITLCIWANLKKNPRFRSQTFYDEKQQPCNGFELPKPLTVCDVAVRILHTHYDHLSPFQTFSKEPPKLDLPDVVASVLLSEDKKEQDEEQQDILKVISDSKQEIKTEQSLARLVRPNRCFQHLPVLALRGSPGKKHHNEHSFSEIFSYPEDRRSSSQESESRENYYNKSSVLFQSTSRAHVSALRLFDISELEVLEDYAVDLHQFMPLGGVYHCDVLKLPPQAKQVKGWTMVEVLDTGLQTYPYTAICEEAEDNLTMTVGITIHLSDSVIYFEEPLIARWDSQERSWRTDDIGEVVYNMREREISFRTNGFFTITLLQDAHLNMPYQSWELQPMGCDQAIFTILSTFVEVQIRIKDNQCMLYSVTSIEDTELLLDLREKWMTPMALVVALKRAGMNLFPSEYSTNYVSVNKKKLLAEIMVYQQMSLVATSFAFGWSKWNLKSGEDNVVFKACEHLAGEELVPDEAWALYMFSGQRAQKLEIKEDSDTFSKNIAEGSEFHSTLYHLIQDAGSNAAMDRVRQSNCLFIDAVYQLLLTTRVLTYS